MPVNSRRPEQRRLTFSLLDASCCGKAISKKKLSTNSCARLSKRRGDPPLQGRPRVRHHHHAPTATPGLSKLPGPPDFPAPSNPRRMIARHRSSSPTTAVPAADAAVSAAAAYGP